MIHRSTAVAALVTAMVGMSAARAADPNSNSTSATLTGVIKSVASGNVIKYAPASDPSATSNLLINAKTAITLDGKPSDVGALKAGMAIQFSSAEADDILTHLDAFTLMPDDKIHTVDRGILDPPAKGKTDQISFMDGQVRRTVALTPDTQITLDSHAATFADLRHGMPVAVTYREGKASLVQAYTAEADGTNRRCEGEFVSGDDKQLAIHVWGDDGFDVKMTLSDDFKITRDNKPAKMSDFKPGEKVVANYIDGIATDLAAQNNAPAGRGPAQGANPPASRPANAPIDVP